jgi:imidazole glycerol phosphate synthase subunit HisF
MTRIGITGTQLGGTFAQLMTLRQFLLPVNTELHHGDCIGVDAQAHATMLVIKRNSDLYGNQAIVIHPSDNPKKRAFCEGYDSIWPEAPYLIRNHNIVNATDLLIAVPYTDEEQLRSGTWATVRYANRIGKLVLVIMRDGSIRPYPYTHMIEGK